MGDKKMSQQMGTAAEAATQHEEMLKQLKEDHVTQLLSANDHCQKVDQAGKEEAERLKSENEALQTQHQELVESVLKNHEDDMKTKELEIEELRTQHQQELDDLRKKQADLLQDSLKGISVSRAPQKRDTS